MRSFTRLVPRPAPRLVGGLLSVFLLTLVALVPAGALAATTAVVQFGNPNAPDADENCIQNPAEPCANAFHKLIPGAVSIATGDTVDFHKNGFHQVAVYAPGTNPTDIQVLGGNRVNDPTNRVFLGTAGVGGDVNVTFPAPGRYLVICNITAHWNQNMWGWVVVH